MSTRRRRSRGEGTIFQLPDGRWRAEVDCGYVRGRRERRVTTRRSQRDAREWLQRTLQEQREGRIANRATTLDEWFGVYLGEFAPHRVSASTLRNYERDYVSHIAPSLGKTRLDQLEPAEVARLYERKLAEGLSPTSVRLIHATLRRALNIAMRWGLVTRNVALLVDPPSQVHREIEPLTLDEARVLLSAAKEDRLEARWVLGLSLGLRQGEALGLWWSDIDLDQLVLHVVRQLSRGRRPEESMAFAPLKSARSRRTLPLPVPLARLLHEHRDRQEEEKRRSAASSLGWQDERLVFATPIGTPIDHSNDNRAFKKLLRQAGIRDVRLHDLRHTAASLLLAQGVHPRIVMEILGHSQIGLTMNTYSHVMPTVLRAAAESMESALWGKDDGR